MNTQDTSTSQASDTAAPLVADSLDLTQKRGPLWNFATGAISLVLFLYPMYCGFFGGPPSLEYRPTYLLLIMVLTVVILPSKIFPRHSVGEWALNAVILAGAAACVWVAMSWLDFALVFSLSLAEKLGCALLILGAMEMTRRTAVKPMNYVAVVAILYALFGYMLPNLFGHAGLSVDRLLWSQIFSTDGLFGTPLAIGANYIGLFVFFAALLDCSGGGQKFMNFTLAIAGRFQGGPAKVAILASALMGMMSGSAVTNIVTTGVITIPMMKRVGYRKSFAAAVEATASLGSQITPPILGATAFLMSEITGYPLITIMGLTLVPCLLFYFCIFAQVHLASLKYDIERLDPVELPNLRRASLEVIPFFVPIIVLIVLLWKRYSADYAVSLSIIAFLAVCLLTRETRNSLIANFMNGLRQGAATCIPLVGSLAIAGVIIGVLTMTGLGDRLSYLIEIVSGGNLHIMIVMTAITCMLLGMGMVTVGAYVLVAVTVAPLMVDLGVELIVAHLFIFYFAVMSAISPPVMVGVFAAASIAGADPIRTAIHALRLSIVGFVVPFIFIYDPQILMIGGVTLHGLYMLASVFVGVLALAIGFERYTFYRRIPVWHACLFIAAAVITMIPTIFLSTMGLLAIAAMLGFEYAIRGRQTTAHDASGTHN
ncbi:TRAP transporter fused permease subunit [Puniceibacterium sp. IMCC21224]|uniref:TRAP transporter permease n=1 Tax=Puniceibacterium sp. IMCC21224 TaxID=1618204 RepID=UPI00064DA7FC|nr:TRAP transporter fused permease subunit [Puniceibacterium sp. IMCC21224]KMK64850.1 TRAP transporter, 4TM/12TM fusion protein [Puniceibacterium sp. IMCC21224]